ncbi:MAG: XdhC family protein [Saprospiraceae bacterium]
MKEIRSIIQAYEHIDFQQEQVALASVVNVEESSYRRIGARMLVRSNGLWIGGISGGCLEGDALKRSQKAIFKNQASKVIYDTMDDDSNQIGVGLGCNGKIEVLFTPIDPSDPNNEINLLKKISTAEQASILLKVIDAPEQSSLLGMHCLVGANTSVPDFATVDPTLLFNFIEETKQKKKPRIFPCQNKNQQQLKLLIEYIRPETRLVIVGDNYDIQAMLGIATEMGWETIVVGKKKKIPKSVYQQAKQVLPYEEVEQIKIHDYTAVLLMTHDYHWDQKMLPIFIKQKPAYLGMLGPKKRLLKMQQDLGASPLEQLHFLFSPTGLEIGAESPQEIALSIAAEIVAVFRNKTGGSLRDKTGTIHPRE